MLKNDKKINYMVGLARKGNDQHRSWTGIKINFWPLVHPWIFGIQIYYTKTIKYKAQ
jgi:hypothetical protein